MKNDSHIPHKTYITYHTSDIFNVALYCNWENIHVLIHAIIKLGKQVRVKTQGAYIKHFFLFLFVNNLSCFRYDVYILLTVKIVVDYAELIQVKCLGYNAIA